MKIQFDIGHPAHVHLWKNSIKYFQKNGHETLVTCRKKEVAQKLLEAEGIDHIPLGKIGHNKVQLMGEWAHRDAQIIKIAKKFNPDYLLGVLNPCLAHASALLHKPCIIFNDSEVVRFTSLITYPFVDAIITPQNYSKDEGHKQIRVNSYKELAYLHKNNFVPKDKIFNHFDFDKTDEFVILRFVSWGASHDIGKKGFSNEDIIRLVGKIDRSVKVLITSERKLPNALDKYLVKFPPELMHDALFYAKAVIGDSQTMTTEAGVLGTPAVRCNNFVGQNDMSNFVELQNKYGLIFNYQNPIDAEEKIMELINSNYVKTEWRNKRETLMKEKIDLSNFIQRFIEKYPSSLKSMSNINNQ